MSPTPSFLRVHSWHRQITDRDGQTAHTQGPSSVAEVRQWDWDQPGWENIRPLWWNWGKDFAHCVYTARFPPCSSAHRTASRCLWQSRRFLRLQIIKIASHMNMLNNCNHLFPNLSKLQLLHVNICQINKHSTHETPASLACLNPSVALLCQEQRGNGGEKFSSDKRVSGRRWRLSSKPHRRW